MTPFLLLTVIGVVSYVSGYLARRRAEEDARLEAFCRGVRAGELCRRALEEEV